MPIQADAAAKICTFVTSRSSISISSVGGLFQFFLTEDFTCGQQPRKLWVTLRHTAPGPAASGRCCLRIDMVFLCLPNVRATRAESLRSRSRIMARSVSLHFFFFCSPVAWPLLGTRGVLCEASRLRCSICYMLLGAACLPLGTQRLKGGLHILVAAQARCCHRWCHCLLCVLVGSVLRRSGKFWPLTCAGVAMVDVLGLAAGRARTSELVVEIRRVASLAFSSMIEIGEGRASAFCRSFHAHPQAERQPACRGCHQRSQTGSV